MKSEKHYRNHHQAWLIAILRAFDPDLKTRETHLTGGSTAIFFSTEPSRIWGELALYLLKRDVLVEHSSNSLTFKSFAKYRMKIAHASHRYFESDSQETRFHPSMVVICHRKPRNLLAHYKILEPLVDTGIWSFGHLEFGPIIVVSTTCLSDKKSFRWLKLISRFPSSGEDLLHIIELINESDHFSLASKLRLLEDIMQISGSGRLSAESLEETLARWTEQLHGQMDQYRAQERAKAREEFRAEIREELRAEIREELRAEIREELRAEIREELRAEIREELRAEIREELRAEYRSEMDSMRAEISALREENAMLRAALEEERAAHDATRVELGGRITELERLVKQLLDKG